MWFWEDGAPRTARPHLAQVPAMSWDVFEADGQVCSSSPLPLCSSSANSAVG